MSDVTVIGLGNMGSALARAFLLAGKTVTVWNRSPARTAPLESLGGVAAASAGVAVAASPVVVVCLTDYTATAEVLGADDVAGALAGRLVIQLTSGTPKQARALDAWVRDRGADYLDGAIAAWPRHIGGAEAAITVVGPQATFRQAESLLGLLAGSVTYMGTDIGHASALFNAGLAYFAGHWLGFNQGAAICQAEGIDPAMFGETMAGLAPAFAEDMRHMGSVIAMDRFEDPESTISTAGADIARLLEASGDLGVGTAFPALAADIFRRASDAGHGAEDHTAVIKVLRSV
ncbi:MAG: NAD(P)-binding domain-containing protein [Mesorhizobium sp.]|nr:NAD(P)-binding domain-containing protein [Mesorhizobium sp.]